MRISDWSSDVCSSDLSVDTLPEMIDRFERRRLAFEFLHQLGAFDPREARDIVDRFLRIKRTALPADGVQRIDDMRSEERRVGNECVSTCRSRWSPYQ